MEQKNGTKNVGSPSPDATLTEPPVALPPELAVDKPADITMSPPVNSVPAPIDRRKSPPLPFVALPVNILMWPDDPLLVVVLVLVLPDVIMK